MIRFLNGLALMLLGLNALWGSPLSINELKKLGLKLGADVPIFIHGHAAWAEGIGEELTNIETEEKWYVLLIPNCHISTAEIFKERS